VWLVWCKVHKTRSEVRDRFGKEVAAALTYDVKPPEDEGKQESGEHKACLYELWDKRRRRVCFLAREYDDLIEDDDPPLTLHGFFPCPEPAYGSKTADSLIPRPDYCYYQDQAEEIDDLTAKIADLTDWLIVKGFIPGGPSSEGADAIERMLREKGKQILVPIESWAGFTERGGSRQIDWLPLDIIVLALKNAIEARQQLIQDVYQITGISDILRGETDPQETLGAQQLKAQTGSRRVRNAKDELARFARDVYRLVCEVIAEQFAPETIAAITGYRYVPGRVVGLEPRMLPPPLAQRGQPAPGAPALQTPTNALPPPAQPGPPVPAPIALPEPDSGDMVFDDQVVERLRNDRVRSYSIDVETDSTIQPDEDAEKQRRTEFATMFAGFLKQASELFALGPMAAPLAPMVAEAIDRAMDQMLAQLKQLAAQPPKPSPEEMKAQLEAKKAEAEIEAKKVDAQLKQQEAAFKQQELQVRLQYEQRMQEMKLAFEQQKFQLEMAFKQQEMAQAAQASEQKLAMEQQSMRAKMAFEGQRQEQELALLKRRGEQEHQQAAEKHAFDMTRAKELAAQPRPMAGAPGAA
jgi:hypothetical protein